MSKTYSNKALPAGTVLREWRLEEVLGVGGFGIVYKGRGIYFNELVAIKEYFPSSISERQEGDTVVPIDSSAEEVHALGLKKFVEEAKLLWNLSKPTRHPNIVSVRSLFEIHGTAYMVMDFEDGMSLSKLLREGKRFNEASLLALIKPIAEGLERAHRVGVLHRDIKPPNILVNEDGRPVLIDFGSARFESGDATSTKVTFHTPPYAAIEQYVKTYDQGPWTDIYALGVVLHECITGEKPPEVLERMHGGLGQPLADGEWPGFSKTFLRAVDTAMIIRPAERPQTISEWLALFTASETDLAKPTPADFDEPTRFVAFEELPEKIVPVAPPPPDFDGPSEIVTPVPESTSGVQFKRAGRDTTAGKTQASEAHFLEQRAQESEAAEPVETPEEAVFSETELAETAPEDPAAGPDNNAAEPNKSAAAADQPAAEQGAEPGAEADRAAPASATAEAAPVPTKQAAATGKVPPKKAGTAKSPAKPKSGKAGLIIGAGVAVVAAIGAGAYFAGLIPVTPVGTPATSSATEGAPIAAPTEAIADVPVVSGEFAQAIQSLAAAARQSGAPAGAVSELAGAGERLVAMQTELASLTGPASEAKNQEIAGLAKAASVQFAAAIGRDSWGRTQKLARDLPWADPRRPGAARAEPAQRQRIAQQVAQAQGGVAAAIASTNAAGDPSLAITSARRALQAWQGLAALLAQAYASKAGTTSGQTVVTPNQPIAVPTPTPTPTENQGTATAAVSPATTQKFNAAVSSSREIASNLIRMAQARKPGSNATKEETDRYQTLQQGKTTAQGYVTYLNNLANSMRGAKTDREAQVLLAQAEQTKRYLNVMLQRSSATQ